ACNATLAQSPGTAAADYTLRVTAPVTVPATGCPASVTVELSQAGTNGGPTINANVCWSTDGTVPLCGAAQAGVTCFSSGGAGAGTATVAVSPTNNTVR